MFCSKLPILVESCQAVCMKNVSSSSMNVSNSYFLSVSVFVCLVK